MRLWRSSKRSLAKADLTKEAPDQDEWHRLWLTMKREYVVEPHAGHFTVVGLDAVRTLVETGGRVRGDPCAAQLLTLSTQGSGQYGELPGCSIRDGALMRQPP